MDDATDEELMARVQHQDRGAFAVLVARHLDGIHSFNYRFIRHADDAADLAQETFLRVWSSAHTWRPNRVRFTTWLYRIARNLCIDAYRRQRETEELDPRITAADEAGPDDAPGRERLLRVMNQGLAELPERQRTALLLCHRQGMTNRQAADVLEVSVDALESLLARARRTLRLKLRDHR
ncbi:MAG: sigma-70 family RNA polymerase sigma factor [Gammaproteobacteria bacterium]|nr:sigma-70 family RNA polymerase sigma factor [Gammaproteobacteria bacterium]